MFARNADFARFADSAFSRASSSSASRRIVSLMSIAS
jgi:hypothetical protein